MPDTPYRLCFHTNMNYLQGQDLVRKIDNLENNDRRFVKESRISKKLIFRNCLNCRAPLLVHRSSEECKNEPTEEDIKNIDENLIGYPQLLVHSVKILWEFKMMETSILT